MRIQISDLLNEGLLTVGDEIEWRRKKSGQTIYAVITEEGEIELPDGRKFMSPSGAAAKAAGIRAVDGWMVWTVKRLDGLLLDVLRAELEEKNSL